MIENFIHKGLDALFFRGITKGVPADRVQKLLDILDTLNAAHIVHDMNFPGAGLHSLKGQLKRFWAVRVSGNWPVTFRFENGNAYDVNYVDYH